MGLGRNLGVSALDAFSEEKKPVYHFHKFHAPCVSIEDTCAVNFLRKSLDKFSRNPKKRYNDCLWKTQMWSVSVSRTPTRHMNFQSFHTPWVN